MVPNIFILLSKHSHFTFNSRTISCDVHTPFYRDFNGDYEQNLAEAALILFELSKAQTEYFRYNFVELICLA